MCRKCSQTQSKAVPGLDGLQFLWASHSKAAALNMTKLCHPQQPCSQRALCSWPSHELNYNQQEKNARAFIEHNGVPLICLPAMPSKDLLPKEGFGVQKWIQATTYREYGRLECKQCIIQRGQGSREIIPSAFCCHIGGYCLTRYYSFIP